MSSLPFKFDLPVKFLHVLSGNLDPLRLIIAAQPVLIGIDTETRPCFVKFTFNKTALIQMAFRCKSGSENVVLVDLHTISKSKVLLNQLDDLIAPLFASEKIYKIGHGLVNDFKLLQQSYPHLKAFSSCRSIVDTSVFMKALQPSPVQSRNDYSLKTLTNHFLHFTLNKSCQCSNWENRPLSKAQIEYAACDALVLLRIYDVMVFQATTFGRTRSASMDSVCSTASDFNLPVDQSNREGCAPASSSSSSSLIVTRPGTNPNPNPNPNPPNPAAAIEPTPVKPLTVASILINFPMPYKAPSESAKKRKRAKQQFEFNEKLKATGFHFFSASQDTDGVDTSSSQPAVPKPASVKSHVFFDKQSSSIQASVSASALASASSAIKTDASVPLLRASQTDTFIATMTPSHSKYADDSHTDASDTSSALEHGTGSSKMFIFDEESAFDEESRTTIVYKHIKKQRPDLAPSSRPLSKPSSLSGIKRKQTQKSTSLQNEPSNTSSFRDDSSNSTTTASGNQRQGRRVVWSPLHKQR